MASPLADRFGRNLQRHRRLAGLNQRDLGELAQLSRGDISAIERGLRLPRLDTILKVSAGVGVSACELLAGLPRWRPGHQVEGGFDSDGEPSAVGARE
jgi:transcriptional regulator with XRE-family HTH domain